jgi:hypothetical protein
MKILWIKTELLHPLDKGGKLRTHGMLRELKRRHHLTYLALDDGSGGADAVAAAAEYCDELVRVPFRAPPRGSPAFFADLARSLLTPLPTSWRAGAPRRCGGRSRPAPPRAASTPSSATSWSRRPACRRRSPRPPCSSSTTSRRRSGAGRRRCTATRSRAASSAASTAAPPPSREPPAAASTTWSPSPRRPRGDAPRLRRRARLRRPHRGGHRILPPRGPGGAGPARAGLHRLHGLDRQRGRGPPLRRRRPPRIRAGVPEAHLWVVGATRTPACGSWRRAIRPSASPAAWTTCGRTSSAPPRT